MLLYKSNLVQHNSGEHFAVLHHPHALHIFIKFPYGQQIYWLALHASMPLSGLKIEKIAERG